MPRGLDVALATWWGQEETGRPDVGGGDQGPGSHRGRMVSVASLFKMDSYFTNSIGMKMVYIPERSFMMGSRESSEAIQRVFNETADFGEEHPMHPVTITKAFPMGSHEVTIRVVAELE